jgi:hypothetical protein
MFSVLQVISRLGPSESHGRAFYDMPQRKKRAPEEPRTREKPRFGLILCHEEAGFGDLAGTISSLPPTSNMGPESAMAARRIMGL